MKKERMRLALLIVGLVLFLIMGFGIVFAQKTGTNEEAILGIWTNGTPDSTNGNLTYGTSQGKGANYYEFYFNANYTNSTNHFINTTNGNGNCKIRFNESGSYGAYADMNYSSEGMIWFYNKSFRYKGNLTYEINCTSNFGNITLNETFFVRNTPLFLTSPLDTIAFNADEDNVSYYNFSQHISDDDYNDVVTYSIENITSSLYQSTIPSFYSWIFVNSSTGMIRSNATFTNQTGNYVINMRATDTGDSGVGAAVIKAVTLSINAVNDLPYFLNLNNAMFNITALFNRTYIAYDEENNVPFTFNVSFLNCSVASWSSRNCSSDEGKALFNISDGSQYYSNSTSFTLSYTPVKNDVGNYTLNVTVKDSLNGTYSKIVNFTVVNINSPPNITYACDNERIWNETDRVVCHINATDFDESVGLNFSANYSWFLFNGTANSMFVNTSGGNASAIVNFTADDPGVGRLLINITVTDYTDLPRRSYSTVIQMNVTNRNDSVSMLVPNALSAFTTHNYTVYVNATDDDLLIPDKSEYNENLTFRVNESGWVSVLSAVPVAGTNRTMAGIRINPALTTSGDHYVNISVNDANNYSSYSVILNVTINSNSPPEWLSPQTLHQLTENISFFLNLSQNVSDSPGDNLTFYFINHTYFPSFSFNVTTGIINFTGDDFDVGLNNITLIVSDGDVNASLDFIFNVSNINDAPFLETPLQPGNSNITIAANSNMSTSEDLYSVVYLYIQDNDLKIPANKKAAYNESFVISVNISGPNTTLINFANSTLVGTSGNRTRYIASFIPRKADVGNYQVLLNVTDQNSSSRLLQFNLTIADVNHAPAFNLSNQTSYYNTTFFYDINASDIEDGIDDGVNYNMTFSYNITSNSTPYLHSLLSAEGAFNITTGMINVSFNDSHVGTYILDITVNDTEGLYTTHAFWLKVYDLPVLISPSQSTVLNFSENINSTAFLAFNHTVGDNLNYSIYIDGILRDSGSGYGNGSNTSWTFRPNFTDESYGAYRNLTILVMNPVYSHLNYSASRNIGINHTNAPVNFSGTIGDKSATYTSSISINLTQYFSDIDFSDSHYVQTLNFTLNYNQSSSNLSYAVSSSYVMNISSVLATSETVNITATDSEYNATSNNFIVEFTEPTTVPGPASSPSSGGGGGGAAGTSGNKLVSLKLILPDPISAYTKEKIVLPVTLYNDGKTDLTGITLTTYVTKNGSLNLDIKSYLSRSYLDRLNSGVKEEISLTVETDTDQLGTYEININATVANPAFKDWGKIYMTINEGTRLAEKIVFTEELIIGNPECAEMKEIVEEAKKAIAAGDIILGEQKTEEALNACKRAISQKPLLRGVKEMTPDRIFSYIGLATLAAIIFGIVFYNHKRRQLQTAFEPGDNI